MTFRGTHVYTAVILITLAFAVASATGAAWLDSAQYALLAAGTIIIGIPHGATDNHVYRHVLPRGGVFSFYAGYLLIAGIYGLLWALAPTASLLIFLLLSIYHFGQSDLFYVQMPENAAVKKLAYLPWGAFVLASPILFRYDQAAPVIEAIVGYDPIPVSAAQAAAPWVSLSLLGLNVVILGILFLRRRLGRADLLRELAGFAVLFTLYATAPLYVSFIVYWAFWHSLNSAIEIAGTWSGPSSGRSAWCVFPRRGAAQSRHLCRHGPHFSDCRRLWQPGRAHCDVLYHHSCGDPSAHGRHGDALSAASRRTREPRERRRRMR